MEINQYEDVLDTRDILEAVEELAGSVEDLSIDDEDIAELASLGCLLCEVSEVSGENIEDGAGLIRDSYFKDYAWELAEDIGAISSDLSWPSRCIDWDQAARELQMDYSTVEWRGVTYWVRS